MDLVQQCQGNAMPHVMDERLFAHILSDPELQGLYELQGHQFLHTVYYLDNYLTTYFQGQNAIVPKQLSYLSQAMHQLVEKEMLINGGYNTSESSLDDLNQLSVRLAQDIETLREGEYLLLPGGWRNDYGHGHAMVYKFTKTAEGVRFSIHNSGAGLNFHEKISFKEGERYYPVKSWDIAASQIQEASLSHLLTELILPNLNRHPARKNKDKTYITYDASLLYYKIEEKLSFLDAELRLSSNLATEELTTASQISGTCAQRVLHQLLKNCFPTLRDYQRFMFHFKMHALEEFTQTAGFNRLPELTRLGIENNTKILKIPGLFSVEEQKIETKRLHQLKSQLKITTAALKATLSEVKTAREPSAAVEAYTVSWGSAPIKDENSTGFQRVAYYPPFILDEARPLHEQLQILNEWCTVRKAMAPLWVLAQIERLMVTLPLPQQFTDREIDLLYRNVDPKAMFECIQQLQKHYQEAYSQTTNDVELPSQSVVNCSLLALQDVCMHQLARANHRASFHPFVQGCVRDYLKQYEHNPYQATNNPLLDQKMVDLMALYPALEKSYGDLSLDRDKALDYYYLSLIAQEPPHIQALLKEIYQGLGLDEALHTALVKENLTQIYLISSWFDDQGHFIQGCLSPEHQIQLQPLIDIFERQFAFETAIRHALLPTHRKDSTWLCKVSVTQSEVLGGGDVFVYAHYPLAYFSAQYLKLTDQKHISHHKYNASVGSVNDVLTGVPPKANDSWNSNHIQLFAHVISKGHDLLFVRDLLHLRTSPDHQVKLTLDYFIKSLPELSDHNTQLYLEANVFELNLLASALQTDPHVLTQWDRLLQAGQEMFSSQGEVLNHESLFLIRLRYLVNQYLAQLPSKNPDFKSLAFDRLYADQQSLTALIEATTDTAVLSILYRYRFLTIVALHDLKPMQSNHLFADMLQSYFYIQAFSHPLIKEDTDGADKLRRAGYHVNGWLNTVPSTEMAALMKDTVSKLGVDVAGLHVRGTYPDFTLENDDQSIVYTVQAQLGRFYLNGCAYAPVPLEVKTHPVMRRLGLGAESSCFISSDGKHIEFEKQHVRVRVGGHLTVQKKWPSNDPTALWYELQPFNAIQRQQWAAESAQKIVAKHNLPKIFSDEACSIWFNENHEAVIFKNQTPLYKTRHQAGEPDVIERLDAQGAPTGAVLARYEGPFAELLYAFEDPAFILSHQVHHQDHWLFELPRYGLQLEIKDNQCHLLGTDYIVSPSASILPNVACLHLSHGSEQKIIVPVQRFCVDSQKPNIGDYYPLKHDISNEIAERKVEEAYRMQQITEKKLWHYDHSEISMIYPVVAGVLKPETTADALYLCYVYLSTHQMGQAWAILDKLHDIELNLQEVTYLSWIVDAVPDLPKSVFGLFDPRDENEKIKTPRYVAVQLKALALLTDAMAKGKKLTPPTDPVTMDTVNGHYEAASQRETMSFYYGLPMKIGELLQQLQHRSRHLEYGFTLTHQERLSLFHHCARLGYPFDGALGYEYRRIQLEALLTEWRHLSSIQQSLIHSETPFPRHYRARMQEIEETVKSLKAIRKKSTQLERREVPLDLPSTLEINDALISGEGFNAYFSWKDNLHRMPESTAEDAIFALHAGMDEGVFLIHFPWYVDIITGENAEQKEKLRDFCVHYLRGSAHTPLPKNKAELTRTNLQYLTNILYRLLSNPACLDSIKKATTHFSWDSPFKLRAIAAIASQQTPAPIHRVQMQDVMEDILATDDEILEALDQEIPIPVRIEITPEVVRQSSVMSVLRQQCMIALSEDDKIAFQSFIDQYDALEKQYHIQIQAEHLTEQAAGLLKYAQVQQQRVLTNTCFASETLRHALINTTQKLGTLGVQNIKNAWDAALLLANEKLNNPEELPLFMEALALQRRPELTQEDLLKLYFNAEESLSIEMTGLSVDAVHRLHQMIHHAVTLEVEQQQLERLMLALENAEDTAELYPIADVLMRDNHPQAQHDSTLMFFQYQENILLHERQVQALTELLKKPKETFKYNEVVEKVIMGGGKSKVILPILVQKKVTGANVVMVEVPRALLTTNYADLEATSSALFNQHAELFDFNRDSDCTPARLEDIYHQLINVMVNKNYVVTTGDAIQSLELKYIEFLRAHPKPGDLQIYWLSKILKLIHERGDVIIDEIHQGLELAQELNYTLGDSKTIPSDMVRNSVQLYQFLGVLAFPESLSVDAEAFRKITTAVQPGLADALVDHPQSPLSTVIEILCKHWGDQIKEEVRAFLNNQGTLDILEAESEAIREQFAFYKAQCSSILPYTLAQKNNESYGSCFKQDAAGNYVVEVPEILDRPLAIPYKKSQPKAGSRFGNVLSTINFTIQALLVDGVHPDLLKQLMESWLFCARQELKQRPDKFKRLEDTPTAKKVNAWLQHTTFKLQTFDFHSNTDLHQLWSLMHRDETLIYSALEEQILQRIQIDPETLLSNAFNHVDLYNSVQGVSGTPYNQTTFHQDIHFNVQTALGTDGYIQEILKNKQTPVHVISTEHKALLDFIDALYRPKARAIIDVGAILAGFNSKDVAIAIAETLLKQHSAIKYVLYYDQNILCALYVKTHATTILESSDPLVINQKLKNCQPHERFTYYDQAHTLGVDLKQAQEAIGMVLIDEKTRLESFLQGAMRMRGLENQQSIELVVPETLAGQSFEELMRLMSTNEQQQLERDNFIATLAKMKNRVRHDLMQRLNRLDDTDSETKSAWLNHAFQSYFIEKQQDSLYAQYAQLAELQDTKSVLLHYQTQLLMDWKTCLDKARALVNEHDLKQAILKPESTLATELTDIINASLPFCPKKVYQQNNRDNRSSEVQTQKEKKSVVEKKEEVHQVLPENRQAMWAWKWGAEQFQSFYRDPSVRHLRNLIGEVLLPLNTWCAETSTALFDPQFIASRNYALTYGSQKNMLGPFVKPVYAILFRWQDPILTACLITNEELDDLKKCMTSAYPDVWISTTQHTPLVGDLPASMMNNPTYLSIIEQLRFFNGEFNLLNEQSTPFQWLTEQSSEKIDFFKTHLGPFRSTKPEEIKQLQMNLKTQLQRLKEIQEQRFDEFPEMPMDISASKVLKRAWEKGCNLYCLEVFNDLQQISRYAEAMAHLTPDFIQDFAEAGLAMPMAREWILSILRQVKPTAVFALGIARHTRDSVILMDLLLLRNLQEIDYELFELALSNYKITQHHDLLMLLVLVSHTDAQYIALMNVTTESVILKEILLKGDLNTLVLRAMVERTQDQVILKSILNHSLCDAQVLNKIAQCTQESALLQRVIEHPACDEETLKLILEKKSVDAHVLALIEPKIKQPALLALFLNHQSPERMLRYLGRAAIPFDYLSDEKLQFWLESKTEPLSMDEIKSIISKKRTNSAVLLKLILEQVPVESQDYLDLIDVALLDAQFEDAAGNTLLRHILSKTPAEVLKKGIRQFYDNHIAILGKDPASMVESISIFLNRENPAFMQIFLSNLPPIIHSKEEIIAMVESLSDEHCIAFFQSMPAWFKQLSSKEIDRFNFIADVLQEFVQRDSAKQEFGMSNGRGVTAFCLGLSTVVDQIIETSDGFCTAMELIGWGKDNRNERRVAEAMWARLSALMQELHDVNVGLAGLKKLPDLLQAFYAQIKPNLPSIVKPTDPITGCDLFLMTVSEITPEIRNTVSYKKPTLVKAGDQYELYEVVHSPKYKRERFTLDSSVIESLNLPFPAPNAPAVELEFSHRYKSLYQHMTQQGGTTHIHRIMKIVPEDEKTTFALLPELLANLTEMSANAEAVKAFASVLMYDDLQVIYTQLNVFMQQVPPALTLTDLMAPLDSYWQEKINGALKVNQSTIEEFQALKAKHQAIIDKPPSNEGDLTL